MKKKRILSIVITVFAVILIALLLTGFYYISVMKRTLKEVTTAEEAPKTILSVYVLQKDSAQSIEDTIGYSYGISSSYDSEAADRLLFTLEDLLKERPNVIEFENVFSLTDALNDQKVNAIILEEAYAESIAEAKGYEWTIEGIRKIDSFSFQEEESVSGSESVPQEIPEIFTVYISGIDTYGDINARSRSDVNILAFINTRSDKILMLSTPRDYYVDFNVTQGAKDKLTHAGIYGIESSMDALKRLYDIEIDYYLKMNFSGFVNIIDALGGIEVYSEYDFSVPNIRDYQKGYNELTGIEALAFARERYSFAIGDYQRGKNQMEVIKAVLKKCSSPAILKNYPAVMNAIAGSFDTNMPENQILSLIKMQIFDRKSWDVSSFTVDGTSSYQPTFSMPGQNLYVILPNEESIVQAKEQIKEISS